MPSNTIKFFSFILVLFFYIGTQPVFANNKEEYENRLWDDVISSDKESMYKMYLSQYPNGHFVLIAKIRIKQFTKLKLSAKAKAKAKAKTVKNKDSKPKSSTKKLNLSKNKTHDINQCHKHLKAKRLTSGKKGNALSCYREILSIEPSHVEASNGIVKIVDTYFSWVETNIKKNRYKKATLYLNSARKIDPKNPKIKDYQSKLDSKT